MQIQIRKATEEDLNKLLEFEQGVITAERPFDSTLKEGEIHYYNLAELIKSPKAEVVVAVVEDQLEGSGYAKIVEAREFQKFTEYAYLGFMYVDPQHRRKGINKLILDELIEWAKKRGLQEVRLDVYNENETAKNAYLKAGFKPNLLEMRMGV